MAMYKLLPLGIALIVALTSGLGACGATGAADGTTERPAPRASATFISSDEVRASNAANAFELIQTARPGWLR
jgi:hypothetical protein